MKHTIVMANTNRKPKSGISLISLIITIIVIIILAAIVIFTGLNTPDRANLAKFVQNISDFREAVRNDYMNKKTKYSIEQKPRSDAQIFYLIAKGLSADDIDINVTLPSGDIKVSSLDGIWGIEGTEAYLITPENEAKIANWGKARTYYESGERHYITDKGDVFVLNGYRVMDNNEEKWYLNERTIKVGSGVQVVTDDNNGTGGGGSGAVDFEAIMAANKDASKKIGIGTDGSLVNMNYWVYKQNSNYIMLYNQFESSPVDTAYIGPVNEGEIVGTVPQYISPEGTEEFYPVTHMFYTFYNLTDLKKSPIIPDTVIEMNFTFQGCTNLEVAPIIPSNVTSLIGAFFGCTSLETAPELPSNLLNLKGTFYGCTELKVAPAIPNAVTSVDDTFNGCTKLETAPTIPANIESMQRTFYNCAKLTGDIIINTSIINFRDYQGFFLNASTDVNANLEVSGSSTTLMDFIATRSPNSNISPKGGWN